MWKCEESSDSIVNNEGRFSAGQKPEEVTVTVTDKSKSNQFIIK
jgi:hypothetical protein